MVRAMELMAAVALAAAMSSSADAQDADWSRAGGPLFTQAALGEGTATAPEASPPHVDPARQPFDEAVREAAARHGLDPKLLHALVLAESGYRPEVCSSAGACGLTQLMPATAQELGVENRFNAQDNLRGGADYLARQLIRFGDVRLALAAYNSGPGRVARLGRVPDIAETRIYVARVVSCFLALTAGRSLSSASQCPTEAQP